MRISQFCSAACLHSPYLYSLFSGWISPHILLCKHSKSLELPQYPFFFFFYLKMAVRLFLPKNITPKLSSQERNPALLKFCSSGKSLHPREEEHCLGNESSHISPGTSDGKAFACSVGDPGFNPWVGNIPL